MAYSGKATATHTRCDGLVPLAWRSLDSGVGYLVDHRLPLPFGGNLAIRLPAGVGVCRFVVGFQQPQLLGNQLLFGQQVVGEFEGGKRSAS